MNELKIISRDQPLTSEDLALCQRVLEAVKVESQLRDDDDEISTTAAFIIEFYRQGVRNFDHLRLLILAARGKS